MKMTRKVEIESVGSSGVSLAVTFKGIPCIAWPHITAPFTTMAPGSPEVKGRDYYIKVTSPGFRSTDEAVAWIQRLTVEVQEVAGKEQQNVEDFKKLEEEVVLP